jgi:hypothetical protein
MIRSAAVAFELGDNLALLSNLAQAVCYPLLDLC